MMLVPVPGFGAGDLSPDGNLAAFLDRAVFGSHTWQETWDPEGLLSTLPAISTTLLGLLTGHLLRSGRERMEIAGWMFVLGWAGILLGLVWNLAFPINKNIWTSSYVLYTSGLASMSWAVLVWIMDIKNHKKWAQFGVIFGTNAITAYVLSNILQIPFTNFAVKHGNSIQTIYMKSMINAGFMPEIASLIWALFFTFLCFIPVWYLYKKKIFLKI